MTSPARAPTRSSTSSEKTTRSATPSRCCATGGTYYLVGYGGTVTLPTIQVVLGEISIVGNLIGTNPDLAGLVTLTGQGKVVLHSTRYPLEAANDAIDDLRHGRIRGRAILIPG